MQFVFVLLVLSILTCIFLLFFFQRRLATYAYTYMSGAYIWWDASFQLTFAIGMVFFGLGEWAMGIIFTGSSCIGTYWIYWNELSYQYPMGKKYKMYTLGHHVAAVLLAVSIFSLCTITH